MLTQNQKQTYYNAFVEQNSEFEGIFFVGITTTGIFCRPTCPARKAKIERCDFFTSAQEALLAGYRPCKRCHPQSNPNQESGLIKTLMEAVEADPIKRWTDADFRALSVDSSTVRRQFKKRFGMTFVAYARARRMGIALKQIRNGASIIEAQQDSGYESGSGFRDAFSRIMGSPPSANHHNILKAEWIDTPLGPMVAIASDDLLYLLEFVDRRGLEREVERMRQKKKAVIIPGKTKITKQIKSELQAYFSGQLKVFKTPTAVFGTDFQQSIWKMLTNIPYGTTCSYAELAKKAGNPSAIRATANANGSNQMAIIIPCHRIIQSNGELAGYSGGVIRKQWLIDHEKSHS